MTRTGAAASAIFVLALAAGTWTDSPQPRAPDGPAVLTGDFHVHAAPGDGMLPIWEVQREAGRRGVDVVGITNHNHGVATAIARWSGRLAPYPIVIPGQELTTGGFHMAAIGVTTMIDWRLPAREAIAAIHAQGGVAIAAHPRPRSYRDPDPEALRALDGAEVAHPLLLFRQGGDADRDLRAFFTRTRADNPDLAPIGSSDFHGGPMGVCRTYLIVDEVSRTGVLEAIRRGRTVASGPGDRLVGSEEHVRIVREHLRASQPPGFGHGPSTWIALLALGALAIVVVSVTRP